MLNIMDFFESFFTPQVIILFLVVLVILIITVVINSIKIQLDAKFKEINNNSSKLNKTQNVGFKYSEKEEISDDTFDLSNVTKILEEKGLPEKTDALNNYEIEQEKKAIISYDELLKNAASIRLNYENEEKEENSIINVKKVDLENFGKEEPTTNEEKMLFNEKNKKQINDDISNDKENLKNYNFNEINKETVKIDNKDNKSFFNYKDEEQFLSILKMFRANLN